MWRKWVETGLDPVGSLEYNPPPTVISEQLPRGCPETVGNSVNNIITDVNGVIIVTAILLHR